MHGAAVEGTLVLWALAIAAWDVWQRRVPNLLLVFVAAPAIVIYLVSGSGLLGIALPSAVIGAGLGCLPYLIGYSLRKVGAGDAKYSAVLGFIGGTAAILQILLLSALIIGLMSLSVLIVAKLQRLPARKVPAAAAISIAFIMQVGWG